MADECVRVVYPGGAELEICCLGRIWPEGGVAGFAVPGSARIVCVTAVSAGIRVMRSISQKIFRGDEWVSAGRVLEGFVQCSEAYIDEFFGVKY